MFCVFANRLLAWFGPVECQNVALKRAGQAFRVFGVEFEYLLTGCLTSIPLMQN